MKKYKVEIEFPKKFRGIKGDNPGLVLAELLEDLAEVLRENPTKKGIKHDYDLRHMVVPTRLKSTRVQTFVEGS